MSTVVVKICGITRLEDAEAAAGLGAWAVGFIFHRESPRFVEPARAGEIAARLPALVHKVGVFVDTTPDDIEKAARLAGLTLVQLHGSETPELADDVARRTGLPVIKALRPRSESDLDAAAAFSRARALLIDAFVPGAFGGTGKLADWRLALAAARYGRVILAGGITPENVRDAIATVRPYGIDVSGGVEDAPGVKNHDRLRRLFERIRD